MRRPYLKCFGLAFGLNLAWEFWHAQFYLNYQGGGITNFILIRAAMVDAVIILILLFLAHKFGRRFKFNPTLAIVSGGLIIAYLIEVWGLNSGRWAYNSLMPIIPFLNIGLTPFIQLALTGYLTQKLWCCITLFCSNLF